MKKSAAIGSSGRKIKNPMAMNNTAVNAVRIALLMALLTSNGWLKIITICDKYNYYYCYRCFCIIVLLSCGVRLWFCHEESV